MPNSPLEPRPPLGEVSIAHEIRHAASVANSESNPQERPQDIEYDLRVLETLTQIYGEQFLHRIKPDGTTAFEIKGSTAIDIDLFKTHFAPFRTQPERLEMLNTARSQAEANSDFSLADYLSEIIEAEHTDIAAYLNSKSKTPIDRLPDVSAVEIALAAANAYYGNSIVALPNYETRKIDFVIYGRDLFDFAQNAETYSTTQDRQALLSQDIARFQASGDTDVVEHLTRIKTIEVEQVAPRIEQLLDEQNRLAYQTQQSAVSREAERHQPADDPAEDYVRDEDEFDAVGAPWFPDFPAQQAYENSLAHDLSPAQQLSGLRRPRDDDAFDIHQPAAQRSRLNSNDLEERDREASRS